MHWLIIAGLTACVSSSGALALDTKICNPQRLCPFYPVCVHGKAVFPSDLHDSMAEVIGWRSQVFQAEKEPAVWSYCYFRAIRVVRPGDNRPIRWRPAGIEFFGATGAPYAPATAVATALSSLISARID